MEYKKTSEEAAGEEELPLDLDKELDFQQDELEFDDQALEIDQMTKKAKMSFSLKARRAIEDHIERRRLRKELDYLFDDGFAEDKKDDKV